MSRSRPTAPKQAAQLVISALGIGAWTRTSVATLLIGVLWLAVLLESPPPSWFPGAGFAIGFVGSLCADSYAPFFADALAVIDLACDEFVPQP